VNKSCCMVISNRHLEEFTLGIDGENVERVNSVSFLGITIDDKLSFSPYIDRLCGKISRSGGVIRRLSRYMPVKLIRSMYFALFYPHLIYCLAAWGSAGVTRLNRVKRIQKRVVKLLMYSSVNPCINHYVLDFDKLYSFYLIMKMHSVVHNTNDSFNEILLNFKSRHEHQTRFVENEKLYFPLHRTAKCQSFFLYRGIHIWNDLPSETRRVTNRMNFRKNIVKLFNDSKL